MRAKEHTWKSSAHFMAYVIARSQGTNSRDEEDEERERDALRRRSAKTNMKVLLNKDCNIK